MAAKSRNRGRHALPYSSIFAEPPLAFLCWLCSMPLSPYINIKILASCKHDSRTFMSVHTQFMQLRKQFLALVSIFHTRV